MFQHFARWLLGVLHHQLRLLGLGHDGRGLPALTSSMLVPVAVLKLATSYFVAVGGLTDAGPLLLVSKSVLAMGLLYGMAWSARQAYVFSGYLLIATGLDLGLLLLDMVVEQVPLELAMAFYAWGLTAFISLLLRAAPHHENEKR